MTALQIEFYCFTFTACVIGFPLALLLACVLWGKLRRARANEVRAEITYAALAAELSAEEELSRMHLDDVEKWKGNARKSDKDAKLFADRLSDALAELDAIKAKRSAIVSRGNTTRYAKRRRTAKGASKPKSAAE